MTILVGYVLSPEGDAALEAAIEEAHRRETDIIVMHASKGGSSETDADIAAIHDAGERIGRRLEDESIPHDLREYVRGRSGADEVVAVAESEGVELIVIGLRHRSLTGKMLLGSNAHDILMTAPCPVLAVRAPD